MYNALIVCPLLILLSVSIGSAAFSDSTSGQIFYAKGGVIYGASYHNLNETTFRRQISSASTVIVRFSLDAQLGWIYFTNFTDDKMYTAAFRHNYLLDTTQALVSYAGQGDPWTRPSFVLDQPDNLLFWTASSTVMRAVSNGAQAIRISDSKLTVAGAAYDKVRKNINFIVQSSGDWVTFDLYTMNIDGSSQQKVGQLFQSGMTSYPQMSIISVHDGLVFVGYTGYDFSSTRQNYIGVFVSGQTKPLTNLWSLADNKVVDNLIVDMAYDSSSQTLLWVTKSRIIWKGQLNSNMTKFSQVKAVFNDANLGNAIAVTESSCAFNCYLNGGCDASTNQCHCSPNYYPDTTCKTYCTREETCSGHGSCSPVNGSCICDLNWEGVNCAVLKKDPPVFPNQFTAKNITLSGPGLNTVTGVIYVNQPLQLQRIDWSNGTVTILRYDLGFRFDLFKGTCNASILSGRLPVFRVPADAVLKGSTQCTAPSLCNEWWSATANQMFYTAKNPAPGNSGDLPVMIKDYATSQVISYDISLFDTSTPDKSVFDFPAVCLPKFV